MRGILRVAAITPRLHLANVEKNVHEHLEMLRRAAEQKTQLAVFPELSLTGASCGNLFFQQTLQDRVWAGLETIAKEMPEGMTAVVGAPLSGPGGLYQAAVVISGGRVQGAAVKTLLNREESAFFRPLREPVVLPNGVALYPNGRMISADGVMIGVELGSELWAPVPPSGEQCLKGAEVIVNLSAVTEEVTGRAYRQQLVRQQSARCLCGYVYASAGTEESTTDTLCAGHCMVAVCGDMAAESAAFLAEENLLVADIDLERIRANRRRSETFAAQMQPGAPQMTCGALLLKDSEPVKLAVSKKPFVPQTKAERTLRCTQIFEMQAYALKRRLQVTGGKVVIGISGGLDSTLALLAAVRAMDVMGLPRTNILGVTMPCFGTTDHTYQSALELMRTLGIQQREIRIHQAVLQHFADIGHDENDHSVTYENAQARERTQVLMDVANDFGGIVLGTGDLSEIALGWCTYNADHMSMYGVNAGIPKTLVRWVVRTVSEMEGFAESKAVLERILDTPISPELLPPDEKGNIAQQTEDLVGPYALHDFFLYYVIRYGYEPQKIYELCCMAFREDFTPETIRKWLKNFYRRFFTQQFKRNCSPDGVKVGSVGLSPRGDWRMPSDAQSADWLNACDTLHD
ncbi:MAG: NAD(+) synthase [Clostridiales bacterium]|nr:NAD(+) synthase [Clostridiales bacterium]